MNSLKHIIQRCRRRRQKPLRQRKTIITPAVYKGLLYQFTAYCAHRTPLMLYDLEQADISFMPTGKSTWYDRLPQSFGGDRFLKRQGIEDWGMRQWNTSWGIQIYTGIPSQRNAAQWHDLVFKYELISEAPEAVINCIQTLITTVSNPLLTLTKSGGLRFSCRVLDYLHPNTEASRFYIYKDLPTSDTSYQRDVYLEILGAQGHSPWDARYEILLGDLLDPPLITKEILFTAVDTLRDAVHAPLPLKTDESRPFSYDLMTAPASLGSLKLDLAKEALLNRGFSYLREANGLHYWRQLTPADEAQEVLLFERDETVWLRASTPDFGLPTQDTPITNIWDDTGILPPLPATGLPVSEKILAIRDAKLSPLAIKRPTPVLHKLKADEKSYQPIEKTVAQVQRVHDTDSHLIGLTTETAVRNNYQIELELLKSGPVSFSAEAPVVKELLKHLQSENLPSLTHWKSYGHRWDQVKDIPADIRMADPFAYGNVCEDADRCLALIEKGGDPMQSICPKCPVSAACRERGYLSQAEGFADAQIQIFESPKTLLDPEKSAWLSQMHQYLGDTQRLCIIDDMYVSEMFLKCGISNDRLQAWCQDWRGHALGNFAETLRNVLIDNPLQDSPTKRLRIVMQTFKQHEAELVRQMCQVNITGKVAEHGIMDDETQEALSHFTIQFQGGAAAYIPRNSQAAKRLTQQGYPIFSLESFEINTDIQIPMSIETAIQLNIFDVQTVEKIQQLPSVSPNPNWTFWHQLKRFLRHYPRDADVPMLWLNNALEFWVPPVVHPSVKKLLLMSPTASQRDFHTVLADAHVETISIHPTVWGQGNQVFQIRNGIYTAGTMLYNDDAWDVVGISKIGERLFLGIDAEIQRDPSLKHAIITYSPAIKQLKAIANRENVCSVSIFKHLHNFDAAFQAADVIWIVGTPFWQPGVIWRQAQTLFGNDTEPLSYEAETEFQEYKDQRIQRIYIQNVRNVITEIIGRAGFNRTRNKKVVLISSLEIPDITDRPETLFFDWEDFLVAGSLENLAETISIRQAFEAERENLTAQTPRTEVERVLGCSSRQANRVLKKLRGGNIPRVPFREQIFLLLADGEKKMAEVTAAIDGHPQAIHKELTRLTKLGEIEKVRRGVYRLPETSSPHPH